MSNIVYVYASYGFAGILVIAVIAWTWTDGALRRRELAALEAAGIRRRSQRQPASEQQ